MASLTLSKLSIENIGPFRERQTFSLEVAEKRPITLLTSLNGGGKTTFLIALRLGLYGTHGVADKRASSYEKLIQGLLRSDVSGPGLIEIELVISSGEKVHQYRLLRRWYYKKNSLEEIFSVFVDGKLDPDLSLTWIDLIEELLPAELIELFFLDAEKIDSLSDPERFSGLLKNAFEKFFGLGVTDSLSNQLRTIERRLLQSSQKGISSKEELGMLEIRASAMRDLIGRKLQDLSSVRNDLDRASNDLDTYTSAAKRSGLDAFNRAESIQSAVVSQREHNDQVLRKINESLSDPILPLVWLGDTFDEYCQTWEQDKRARQATELIEEIRKRDQRILRMLPESISKDVKSSLVHLFSEDLAQISNLTRDTFYFLPSEDPVTLKPTFQNRVNEIKILLHQIKQGRSHLEKVEADALAIPQEDQVDSILSRLKDLSCKRSELEMKLQSIEGSLNSDRVQLQGIEGQIELHLERLRKEYLNTESISRASKASTKARNILSIFKSRLLASKVELLSQKILFEFISLLRKKEFFIDIEINPLDFTVKLINSQGTSMSVERLSAGERQLFAVSVLRVFIQESKSHFPVVVDTPLARLDSEYRRNLVEGFLAEVSHQVIVLSTDEEVNGSIYKILSPFINHEYMLHYMEKTNTSISEEVVPEKTRKELMA
ncbi:MAG: DNA sulfur modification protein DndD [Leptospirillum sp.]|jgi:DNA sulfur modification protein DndD